MSYSEQKPMKNVNQGKAVEGSVALSVGPDSRLQLRRPGLESRVDPLLALVLFFLVLYWLWILYWPALRATEGTGIRWSRA